VILSTTNIKSIFNYRSLIIRLVRRDLESRYKGSLLGIFWALLIPILMLSVYTFVFTKVFHSQWANRPTVTGEYSLNLFCGLLLFGVFSDSIVRSPRLILDNASYVKKVLFPLEILSYVTVGAAILNATFGFTVFFIFYLFVFGLPPITCIMLPIVWTPMILFTVGLVWFISSIGVYFRDIQHVVGVAISLLLFLTPIFYPLSALPAQAQSIIGLNPLSVVIESTRMILFQNQLPSLVSFVISLIIGIVFFLLGNFWFANTRRGFADVL
jgi:lipopolysaccharide transport system permease protein